jgi:hypothetical protein
MIMLQLLLPKLHALNCLVAGANERSLAFRNLLLSIAKPAKFAMGLIVPD